jgi:F420-0:gamma-glutamyl ligase
VTALEVVALPTPHRFAAGDDLAAALLDAADRAGHELRSGDVVCVASKVVSLVEDAIHPLDPSAPDTPKTSPAVSHWPRSASPFPRLAKMRVR